MAEPTDVLTEIQRARARLPRDHQALLDDLRIDETVIEDWPHGVLDLFRTIREPEPASSALSAAVGVYLLPLRLIAFNARFLREAIAGLDQRSRGAVIAALAWHEYGHALSLTRSTPEQRRDGVRLLRLLPDGMRRAIDYPGGYRSSGVFDEVIATVYSVLIEYVRTNDYGRPSYLHADVFEAFKEVIPWPPNE